MFVKFYICFRFATNQRKNMTPEMTIQECVYYTIFSVHCLLHYIVSVTYTICLYIDMTIVLKRLNEMQQTASMRLTIIQHDITVIYVTYFQIYYYLISLDYGLPNDLHKIRFVDCKFLKPNYISHIMKCASFSADKALPCNSQIHYVTLKIGIPIVLISSYFLFLRINIKFYLKENC